MGRNRAIGDTNDVQFLVGSGQTIQIAFSFDQYLITDITAVGITLLTDPNRREGDTVLIADVSGKASAAMPVTVTPSGSDTINEVAGSIKITTPGGALILTFDAAAQNWAAVSLSGGSALGALGNVFVLRPGAAPGGNVFADWPSLYVPYNKAQGKRWVYVDDSLAAAHMTAGTWNIDQTEFDGNFNANETLHFDQGCTVSFNNIWIDGDLIFQNNSTNPVFTFANGQSFAVIEVVLGVIQSTTAAPWALSTNTAGGTEFLVQLSNASTLGDGTHPAISSNSNVPSGCVVNAFGQDGTFSLGGQGIAAHALGGTGTILVEFGPGTGMESAQDVATLQRASPYLNLAEGFNSGGALGPASSVNQPTGNIARIRQGNVRVVASLSGVTSIAATVTLQLLRDGATVLAQAVLTTQADNLTYADGLQAIDTLPDSSAHTYSIAASAGGGATTTVAQNQARIDADEL